MRSYLILFSILVVASYAFSQEIVEPEFDWHDVTDWGVEGRALGDEPRARWFDRLPASAEGKVREPVWRLSRDSTGMMVRFETDATDIWVDYKLMDDGLAMPHMPATGVSGIDLYARDETGARTDVRTCSPSLSSCRRPTDSSQVDVERAA